MQTKIVCEQILSATSRRPKTDYLDLERAGVRTDDSGFVNVKEEMQTSAPNIWASGDVIDEPMLESIAAKEVSVAVYNALS